MAQRKKFKTPRELERAWEAYKTFCDDHTVTQRTVEDGRERRIEQSRPLSYTVEGFCAHVRMSRQGFYKTYSTSKQYSQIFERIKEECEVDARQKFETGQLPCKLAGLWMSRYGYSARPAVPEVESDLVRFEDI